MTYNDPKVPYNDLPLLPPDTGLDEAFLTKSLIEARVVLAKLDQATSSSNFTAALAAAIPLVEAQASSAIENIVTTHDDLFTAAVDNAITGDKSLEAVMRYHAAIGQAVTYLETKPINPALTKLICSQILGVDEKAITIGIVNAGARDSFLRSESDAILRDAFIEIVGLDRKIEVTVDPSIDTSSTPEARAQRTTESPTDATQLSGAALLAAELGATVISETKHN